MTTAEAREPSPRSLFITGLGIGQICSWGSLYYSFPLIAEAMRVELGWSKTELYGAATLGLALAGLAAYPVGSAIDRGQGRLIMAGGSVLAGALLLAWSQAANLLVFYICAAGIGALQAATLYEPAFAVVARRAGADHARAGITALTLWGGFASTAFIPLVQLLLDLYGWRHTLMVLGAINLVLCAALYAGVIRPERDHPAAPHTGAQDGSWTGNSAVRWAMHQPVFWALAVAFTAYAATFSAFTFHLYPLLGERGFDSTTVVAAMAIIGPAQVAGRLAIWLLAPGASVRVIGCVVVLVFPITLLALELPPHFAIIAIVAAMYGAANGIMTIVRGLAVPEMLTRRAYGAVNGALTAPASASRAIAPVGAALLWSASGSYDAVLLALLAGTLVLALGFWSAAALSRRAVQPA
ncbi:MFS transporter [Ancylobacter dichloromethanicus]|uniref:MFS transporter n=1 Tax=Ancylobacter dichloromethanicus TaxID=518825 RepID=A0A9W6JFC8_9HYPH|nr:MFS transporter [Ancylobacter dichloromethanicus]MBS7552910.1 MFS transporter [Ancylobacter dichloromethanicus]GLK74513.1 MFS transporter [Ancylobacter dichloromethanicus]